VKGNCRAIDLVLQKGKSGEVYNIGGNCEKRNIGVVKQICSVLEEKLEGDYRKSELGRRLSTIDY